jgi:hypothetical protein
MQSSLTAFVGTIFDLCRFRRAPQDLAYSPQLLALLLVASTMFDMAVAATIGDTEEAFAHSLLSSVLVLALCWIALAIRNLKNRYVQTATALISCGLLISVAQLPVVLLIQPLPADGAAGSLSAFQLFLRWAALGMLVWQVLVYAHIMRHAMDSRFGLAVVLTTSWVIAYLALASALFGAQG